jgi:hypothetical protein
MKISTSPPRREVAHVGVTNVDKTSAMSDLRFHLQFPALTRHRLGWLGVVRLQTQATNMPQIEVETSTYLQVVGALRQRLQGGKRRCSVAIALWHEARHGFLRHSHNHACTHVSGRKEGELNITGSGGVAAQGWWGCRPLQRGFACW